MSTQQISEEKVPKYVQRPKRKIIDFRDYFTSTDEALDEILRGLNHLIYRLDLIIGRLGAVPPALTITAPPTAPTTVPTPTVTPPTLPPQAVIALPPSLKITKTTSIELRQKMKIMLQDDYFIITPDDDVIIYETEYAQGFILRSGVYYGMARDPELKELWVEPMNPPTKIYLSFYKMLT
jgi:hypothetical protein